MPDVYLSIGSNQDAEVNLRNGIARLRKQVDVLRVSSVYESAAADGVDAHPYLNAAIALQTDLAPDALKATLIEIEDACGRVRRDAQGNKPNIVSLDFDILLYGKDIITYQHGEKVYHLPHTDIQKYAHVAIPLAQLAPLLLHPTTLHSITHIAQQFDVDSLRKQTALQL